MASTADESKSTDECDKNVIAANNSSADASFIRKKVNDHAAIQHQSSDQHAEL